MPETFDETRPQRRLVLVDAAQDAREAFAGDQHEIVEAAVGELHGEREHLRAVRRIVDGDQRAAQHFGAAAFEQCAEDFQLAHLGYRDCLAFAGSSRSSGLDNITIAPSAGERLNA